MSEIPEQRAPLYEDEMVEALKARFAKAWWEGYATGVSDVTFGEETPNPWAQP